MAGDTNSVCVSGASLFRCSAEIHPTPSAAATNQVVRSPELRPTPEPARPAEFSRSFRNRVEDVDLNSLSPFMQKRLTLAMATWTRAPASSSDDPPYLKILHVIFPEPVVVRAGHFEIGGGVVTAIKAKNPFGLLNPEVLLITF